jgi:hypothetical protein
MLFKQKARDIGHGLLDASKATFSLDLSDRSGIGRHGDPVALAKRIFHGLRRGNLHSLYLEDFIPHFENQEEAQLAFLLFDSDENGNIFHLIAQVIYLVLNSSRVFFVHILTMLVFSSL